MSNDVADVGLEPGTRERDVHTRERDVHTQERDVYESAALVRRSAEMRAKILGVEVEGKAWDLMVDAFLARLEPANPILPMIPMEGAVLESLDPLVIAGLVVVIPDAHAQGVVLELSAEGLKRVRRLFTVMAREQVRLGAAGDARAPH